MRKGKLKGIASEVSGLGRVRIEKYGNILNVEEKGGFLTELGRYTRPAAPVLAGLGFVGGPVVLDALVPEIGIVEKAYADENEGKKWKFTLDNTSNIKKGLLNDNKFLADYGDLRLGGEYFLDTEGKDNHSFFTGIPFSEHFKLQLYGDKNGKEGRLIIVPDEKFTIITGLARNSKTEENEEKTALYGALDYLNEPLGAKNNFGGGVEIRDINDKTELGAYGFLKVEGFLLGYGKYPEDEQHIILGVPGNKSPAFRYFRIDKGDFDFNHVMITPHEIGVADIDFVGPLKDDVLYTPSSIALPNTNPNRFPNYDISSRGRNWILGLTHTKEPGQEMIDGEFIKYVKKDFWLGAGYKRLRGDVSDDQVRTELGYTPGSFFDLEKGGPPSLKVVLSYSPKRKDLGVAARLIVVF